MTALERPYTIKCEHRISAILSEVGIRESKEYTKQPKELPERKIIGVWDTGASMSSISNDVLIQLGYMPYKQTQMQTANGTATTFLYKLDIYMPNMNFIPGMIIAGINIQDDKIQMLIGMDIITYGDFAITNFMSKTIFSFRIPSLHSIDYVKELHKKLNRKKTTKEKCSCDSGKKVRDCCGQY